MSMRGWALLSVPILLSFCGCASTLGTRFSEDGRLLLDGPSARLTPAYVAEQRAEQVAILYEFAVEAGQIRSPSSGTNPIFLVTDVQSQQIALLDPNIDWKEVTVAGEGYIDSQCNRFLTALDKLEKSKKTTLANLNAIAGATVGIMGLAQAAQTAIGITGIALGLVGSLFDTTTSTVLYQLPASAISSIVQAQRQVLRLDESTSRSGGPSEEWKGITNQATAAARLSDYIQYCAPVTIEANITKVLSNTRADTNRELVVTATPPAASSTGPATVQAAPPAPAPGTPSSAAPTPPAAGPGSTSRADVAPGLTSGGTSRSGRPVVSPGEPLPLPVPRNPDAFILGGRNPVETELLRPLGKHIQSVLCLPLEQQTGDFGDPATREAIKSYRSAIGPNPSEDPLSRREKDALLLASVCDSQYKSAYERFAFPTPEQIKRLQRSLGNALSKSVPPITVQSFEVNGTLDTPTRDAIRALQRLKGFPETGIMTRQLRDKMAV
jgi:hypothetical protein